MIGKEKFLKGRLGGIISEQALDTMEEQLIKFDSESVEAKFNFYGEETVEEGDIVLEVIIRVKKI